MSELKITKPLIKEIVEQICLSLELKGSHRDPTNKLALIILDNAVEIIIKFYASYYGLIKDREMNSQDAFFSILDKIKDQNKIVDYEEKDIMRYHKMLEKFHSTDNFTIPDSIIDEYVILAKILLARLYNYRATKLEWNSMAEDIRRRGYQPKKVNT